MSTAFANDGGEASTLTLGELLYAHPAVTCVPEKDWLALVRAVAAGDENAFRVLFEKSYPVVFMYVMRLTEDRDATENAILDAFQDIWCEAPIFDAKAGPVLGWVLARARSVALADATGTQGHRRSPDARVGDLLAKQINSYESQRPVGPHSRSALAALDAEERESIEAALLQGLSYVEVAAQQGQSIGTIKKRIRSGLAKLRQAMQAGGDES